MDEIIEAKRTLYGLLLSKDDPTDTEINIMYELAKDSDIRELLNRAITNDRVDSNEIDWVKWRDQVKKQAKEFVEAKELDQIWYIAGEIVGSAMVCSAWDENISKVCEWVIINGKGLQPDLAQHLIDKNN